MPWAKVVASILSHELRSSVVKDAALLIARILLIVAVAARVPWLIRVHGRGERLSDCVRGEHAHASYTVVAGILAFVSIRFCLDRFQAGSSRFKLAAWLLVVQSNSDRPWMSINAEFTYLLIAKLALYELHRLVAAVARRVKVLCLPSSPPHSPTPLSLSI